MYVPSAKDCYTRVRMHVCGLNFINCNFTLIFFVCLFFILYQHTIVFNEHYQNENLKKGVQKLKEFFFVMSFIFFQYFFHKYLVQYTYILNSKIICMFTNTGLWLVRYNFFPLGYTSFDVVAMIFTGRKRVDGVFSTRKFLYRRLPEV